MKENEIIQVNRTVSPSRWVCSLFASCSFYGNCVAPMSRQFCWRTTSFDCRLLSWHYLSNSFNRMFKYLFIFQCDRRRVAVVWKRKRPAFLHESCCFHIAWLEPRQSTTFSFHNLKLSDVPKIQLPTLLLTFLYFAIFIKFCTSFEIAEIRKYRCLLASAFDRIGRSRCEGKQWNDTIFHCQGEELLISGRNNECTLRFLFNFRHFEWSSWRSCWTPVLSNR